MAAWLVTYLARLRAIEGLYDYRELAVLIDDDLPETHLDSLRELGIRDERMIRCADDEVVACRELVVPTPLAAVDVVHPYALGWLRSNFVEQTRDQERPRRLFVSRSEPHRRRFLNEDEIFGVLEQLGFTKITPDAMSFRELCRAFQNADVIVGPFGTSLVGLAFAPPNCTTFQLIDEKSARLYRFGDNMARQLGQRFQTIFTSTRPTASLTVSEYDFEVNANKLLAQIGPALAGTR